MKSYRKREEEGFVIVVVAILLVVLIGFVALGVDIGVLYSARTSAQEIADSAALAGAFTFITNTTAPQPATAEAHANQVALNSPLMGTALEPINVTAVGDAVNRRVTVDVSSTQPTFFARIFGTQSADISVRAIAEAGTESTEAIVKPWFIPNSVLGDPKGDCDACTAVPPQILISGGQVTDYAKSKYGTQIVLKPNNPSGALAPGDFYGIQMPNDNNSGSLYRDNIAYNLNPAVKCADSYDILKGNKVGPTKQGVDELIGKPPRDTFQAVGEYLTPTGLSDVSDALISTPIWDSCGPTYCPGNNFPSGQAQIQIVGFALVFLDGIQGSDVKGHLISVSACGAPSAPSGSSVLSLPLRLIRVP
jgi:hypothetical protein